MAISVSFPFSWAAQPRVWGPASLGAGFLYHILSPVRLIPKTQSESRGPLLPGAVFSTASFSNSLISKLLNQGSREPLLLGAVFSTASFLQLFWSPNSLSFLCTELYNSSTPTESLPITGHRNMHFCRLWNGMFDHHRAEITVMQFTCHSLLVHQFVTVPWDFNPVQYCQPSSPTPMEYATSAVFGMACLAGSEVNILQ